MTDEQHDGIDPDLVREMAAIEADLSWHVNGNGHHEGYRSQPRVIEHDEPPEFRYRMTDQGAANYLVDRFGHDMMFVDGYGWLTWEGKTWVPNSREFHQVRDLYARAIELRRDELRIEGADPTLINRFNKAYETSGKATSVILQVQKDLVRDIEDLDSQPDLFNCANGVIDLKTGVLYPHERSHLLTRVSPTEYVEWDDLPRVDRDRFMRYLNTACEENVPLMRLCCRAAGYSLTGHTKEEVFFLLWGTTRSGKSTLTEGLASVLGSGYAGSMEASILMQTNKHSSSNVHDMMARVAASRMINCAEPNKGERFAEGLIKMITSGDKLTAVFKYKSAFEFTPCWKIWLSTNHAPDSSDIAVFKRIVIIPFRNTIPDHEIDRTLKPWLKDPTTGGKVLLSWAVEGARRWYEDGLRYDEVEIVQEWMEKYIDDQDPVGRFLKECTVLDHDVHWEHWPILRELYDVYCSWHYREVGHKVMGLKAFNAAMEERGIVRKRPSPSKPWRWQYLVVNEEIARKGL